MVTRSKAEAESNKLPILEKAFRMWPNKEVKEQHTLKLRIAIPHDCATRQILEYRL